MNRYSKTRLRQGLLPRQPPAPPPETELDPDPPPAPASGGKDRGVAREEQALLFDLSDDVFAPPASKKSGSTKR